MVKVPYNNLQAMAAGILPNGQSSIEANTSVDHNGKLIETWNEQSAKKAMEREGVLSPTNRSLNETPGNAANTSGILRDSNRSITPKRIGGNLIVGPRSPIHSTSVVP